MNVGYTNLNRNKIESGVIFDVGPGRLEGLIGVGEPGRPFRERIEFNPAAHRRVCATGDNELLWLPGSPNSQQIKRGKRVVFQRQRTEEGKIVAGLWTSVREYLRVLAFVESPERYVISYDGEGEDEEKERWVGAYSKDFNRRIDIEGSFPSQPADQHTVWQYNRAGKAVLTEPLASMGTLFYRLRNAPAF